MERAGYLRRVPDPHDRRGALELSDAGGHGRVARVGLAGVIAGQLIVAAAETVWPSTRDLGEALFGLSRFLAPVTGLAQGGGARVLTWSPGKDRVDEDLREDVVAALGLLMFARWIPVRRARAATPTGGEQTAPAERHFPVPVVAGHGLAAVVTVVLVLLTALGFGG